MAQRQSVLLDDEEMYASSEGANEQQTGHCGATASHARPRRVTASQNKHIRAVFVSGSSSEDSSADGEDGTGEGPIEETTAVAPDGSVIKVTYRGVDASLTAGSKEWKKAKRLADNRASAARSRALQRLKVGDLGKQLADAHDSFEALVEENAKLKAILAAHGLSNELVKASCTASFMKRAQETGTPAAPKKASTQKASKRQSPPVMTRTSSASSTDTAAWQSAPASSSPSAESDATFSSPVSVSSALLPIDEEGHLSLMTDAADFNAMLPLPAARETSMAAEMCLSSFPPAPAPAGGIRGFSLFAGMSDVFAGLPSMPAASPSHASSGFAFAPAPACRSSSVGSMLLSPQAPQFPPTSDQLCGSKRSRVPSSASCGFDLSEDIDEFAEEIERQAGQPLSKRSRAFSPLHFMLFGAAVLLACITMPAGEEGNSISTIRGRMLLSDEMHHEGFEQNVVSCSFSYAINTARSAANSYMHSTLIPASTDTRCPQTWQDIQQVLGDHAQEFLQGLMPYVLHFCLATGPVVGMIFAHMWASEPVAKAAGKQPQTENHVTCPGSPVSNAALSVTQFMDDLRMGVCQLLEAST